jgi:hypothetical protein
MLKMVPESESSYASGIRAATFGRQPAVRDFIACALPQTGKEVYFGPLGCFVIRKDQVV